MTFAGAKLALFLGADLLTILRDERAGIPYPGHWDLPGGGREDGETPQACVLRETWEEVGLKLSPGDLVWSTNYQRPHGRVWFFAAHMASDLREAVRFGSEGQCWRVMPPEEFCAHPKAVPHFANQLRYYLASPAFPKLASGFS